MSINSGLFRDVERIAHMDEYDIVTVGQLVFDIVAKPVNRMSEPGECQMLETIEYSTGGCTLNTAVILAKLNVRTAILGLIGNDAAGKYLRAECDRFGIDTIGLNVREGVRTTTCMVMVTSSGEPGFFYRPGGTERFSLADVDHDVISRSDYLHISGVMKLRALDVTSLLKAAKQAGKTVTMDVDYDPDGRWPERVKPYLGFVDLFMPSESEAALITGKETPEDMARFLLRSGLQTAVIKLGCKGSFYMDAAGASGFVPSFKVDVVDATGAGDAFCAGFLSRFIKGASLAECCLWGNACGALTITVAGAGDGIKNAKQVEALLAAGET